MVGQNLNKLALLGSVSISSFLVGSYFERKTTSQLYNLKTWPSLTIFGTVSAATTISPVPSESNVSRISQIMKYGFPGLDNIRSFDNYVLSYDKRNRVAHWVFEHITAESIKANEGVDRSKCDFKPDESIHPYFRYVFTTNL